MRSTSSAGCFFDCPEHSEAGVIDENIDPAEAAYTLAIAATTAVLANNAAWAQSLGQLEQAMDPKHKKIVLVNNQSSAADVFINFASNSVITVTNLGGFFDSQSIGSLHCHHTLAATKSE